MLALAATTLVGGCSAVLIWDPTGADRYCGDGKADSGEECDDGNLVGGDGCSPTCTIEVCGNDRIDVGEQCDGQAISTQLCADVGFSGGLLQCTADCRFDTSSCAGTCGDGLVSLLEECDDGATADGDGCSATCQREPGWTCSGGPSSCTPICGDGRVVGPEACDDGNTVGGDGCSADCRSTEICGNGILDAAAGEECDDDNAVRWDGCTDCRITEYMVPSSPAGDQSRPVVGIDDSGRLVFAWGLDDGVDGTIRLRRQEADGTFSGAPWDLYTPVAVSTPPSSSIGVDPDGGFAISYTLGGDVYFHVYDNTLTETRGQTMVHAASADGESQGTVARGVDGRTIIAWASGPPNDDAIIHRRFDSGGTALAPQAQVASPVNGTLSAPHVAVIPTGEYIIVYHGRDAQGYSRVYYRRYDSTGSAVDNVPVLVYDAPMTSQYSARVAMAPDQRFVVVWEDANRDPGIGGDIGVFGQRFDANGFATGSSFPVHTNTEGWQTDVDVAMDSQGNFIAVWHTVRGVAIRRFAADGTPLTDESMLNRYDVPFQSAQSEPRITLHPDGRYAVVWYSQDQDGSEKGVYAQRFRADDTPIGVGSW